MNKRAVIQSVGHAVPSKVVTNDDLERMVDTSDEWIVQRTGIKERHICQGDEGTGSLALEASREAVERSGIPASELPHIFEPFYRGADAQARQVHGNGLGLSLVKRIVASHGGRVTVSSRPGAGTAFTIALPAADVDARPAAIAGDLPVTAHS